MSRQLPTIVFLPMFEVGVVSVKDEIQRRLEKILNAVFDHYEDNAINATRLLCSRYNSICSRLSVPLTTPNTVVEMDKYKLGLAAEIGRVQ